MVSPLAIVVLLFLFIPVFKALYYAFDHSGTTYPGMLDPDAKVVAFTPERVKYLKNDAKFKTTVRFSDGFYFITHKTKRSNHFMSYEISIDQDTKDEIIAAAVAAHDKAVRMQKG